MHLRHPHELINQNVLIRSAHAEWCAAYRKLNPDVTMVNPPRASSLLFDLNGEASTAKTKQISAIIAPT